MVRELSDIVYNTEVDGGFKAVDIFGEESVQEKGQEIPNYVKYGRKIETSIKSILIDKTTPENRRNEITKGILTDNADIEKAEKLSSMEQFLAFTLDKYSAPTADSVSSIGSVRRGDKIFSHMMKVLREFDYKDATRYLSSFQELASMDRKVTLFDGTNTREDYVLPQVYPVLMEVMTRAFMNAPCLDNKTKEDKVEYLKGALDIMLKKTRDIIEGPAFVETKNIDYVHFFGKRIVSECDIRSLINKHESYMRLNKEARKGKQNPVANFVNDGYNPITEIRYVKGQVKQAGHSFIFHIGGEQNCPITLSYNENLPFKDRDGIKSIIEHVLPKTQGREHAITRSAYEHIEKL